MPAEEQINEPIIYISEDLTRTRSTLYKAVLEVTKPKKWQTWTENGVISVRNSILGPAKKINNHDDIKNLTNG